MALIFSAFVAAQVQTGAALFTGVQTLTSAVPSPRGVAVRADGAAIVTSGDRVIAVQPDGRVNILAGSDRGYLDGPIALARFKDPAGVAVDPTTGAIYVADSGNHCIRVIANGSVTTLAGNGGIGFDNGRRSAATFKMPIGLALDAGVLYAADAGNSAIRRVTLAGDVTTFAGDGRQGSADGAAATATFKGPEGVAARDGVIYVADTKNSVIRRIADGQVTTLAANAGLREPGGIAVNDDGSVVIADTKNNTIRALDPVTGNVATIAGSALSGFLDGPLLAARFDSPVAVAAAGAIFVADQKNAALRVIDALVRLTAIDPPHGPAAGGNSVRVSGSGFLPGATTVRFGSASASSIEVISSRELTAIVPPGTGSVTVTVRTPGGDATLAAAYSYARPPVIHGFTPAAARTGATLTILGESFDETAEGNQVTIGGAVASVIAATPTTLAVVVPPDAVDGPVMVTTSSGTAMSATAFVMVRAFGLQVTPETVSIAAGEMAQLTATLTFNDGGITDATALATWTTGDPDVATVNAGGVTATGSGSASITASFLGFSDAAAVTVVANEPLPPDPSTLAPPPDRTIVTSLAEEIEFLYSGPDAIQTGVAPGTIRDERAAVLRGRVISATGAPLPGVTVTITAHPDLGQTLSRADGWYDLVVNGGGPLTVAYEKTGYISAHRLVTTRWNDQKTVDDVALVRYDAQSTRVTMGATTMQVARGSVVNDTDGTRRATLLIPAGVTATLVRPNGSTEAAPALNLRATEYSVGPNGRSAMPADLPPTSAYTYCVEISADEAVTSGASEVRFSRPVPFYVENFIGFPTGMIVPVGFYDRMKRAWMPSDNGRVIAVLAVAAGVADVDTDGDGAADDGAALGMDLAERQTLATLYSAGQSLWRVPIPHLTPWDCNWPYMPPAGATGPRLRRPQSAQTIEGSCKLPSNSTVDCQNQTLGEGIGITGTPFSLLYDSGRVANRNRAEITLTNDAVPEGLRRIEVTIGVAGRSYSSTFTPSPNLRHAFTWDGRDAYGRLVQGTRDATVSVEYVYGAVYAEPVEIQQAFLSASGEALSAIPARQEFVYAQSWTIPLGQYDVASAGLGGWTLDAHKIYDGRGRVLYDGDANRVSDPQRLDRVMLLRVAGTGDWGDPAQGQRATMADLYGPVSVAAASDGSFFIAEPYSNRIHRVSASGMITTIAGNGSAGFSPDGTPAASAALRPWDIAIGPDDSLYLNDQGNFRVRRIVNGLLVTVAGTGADGSRYSGPVDGLPARNVPIGPVEGIAIAPDGTLYLSDGRHVRAVAPNGIIRTIAGDGISQPTAGNGGPALRAGVNPRGLAVGADGAVYLTNNASELRRIRPDGIIERVTSGLSAGWGVAAAGDGSMLVGDLYERVVRKVNEGTISTFAGNRSGRTADGELARASYLSYPWDVDVAADGSVFIVDHNNSTIHRTSALFPAVTRSDETLVASAGGEVAYIFAHGRHIRTVDTLTGTIVHTFGYDVAGWLVSITDADGNVTTIERNAHGLPEAIVAPGGQRTTLRVTGGTLTTISNPAGESNDFTYDVRGFMRTRLDPNRNEYAYTFDANGRLTRDADPVGGFLSLERAGDMDDFTILRGSAEGREHRYRTRVLADTTDQRSLTAPWGLSTDAATFGMTSGATLPDGTTISTQSMADPRFGAQAASLGALTVTLPSGLTKSATAARAVTLADPLNPLSLTSITDTLTVNGRTWRETYDAASRRITSTSPTGRQTTATLDAQGRIAAADVPGLAGASAEYDAFGRLSKMHVGSRTWSFGYDTKHRMTSITNPLSQTTTFDHDLADRVTTQTMPGARTIGFGYDANGNVTSITPPSRPSHGFGYTAVNLANRYSPPGDGATQYVYDRDRRLKTVQRPDGSTLDLTYESGRLTSIATGRDRYSFTYNGTTGTLAAMTGPDASLAFTYDGSLVQRVVWSGELIRGDVAYTYDRNFRVLSENGTDYSYDADGLLQTAGALTLHRDPANGLLTGSRLSIVRDSWGYNDYGEATTYTATVSANPLASFTYERDDLGRIRKATEVIGGAAVARDFTYDVAGRLESVTYDGTHTVTYGYGANSNRVSKTTGTVTESATYDDEDRLLTYGGTSYTYTAAGELRTKTDASGTTTYDYDAMGNLRKVERGDGAVIEYLIDGQNRRIGRRVDGVLTHQLRVVAELNATGTVASRFVYATRINVPDYMLRAGVTYRIISDHVGSPRLVVNTTTGAVVQSLSYDDFGNVLSDTNPGFQPFGFAGGLYDVATGLVRFGARDYDPRIGRWTAKDPIGFRGGDSNVYAYVASSPVNAIDPAGLSGKLTVYSSYGGGSSGPALFDSHSWIVYTPDGGSATSYGTFGFGVAAPRGLNKNWEIDHWSEYADRSKYSVFSRTQWIDDAQEASLMATIDHYRRQGELGWTSNRTCSTFASDAWRSATGEALETKSEDDEWASPITLSESIVKANGGIGARYQVRQKK
ncbi:MAG TPA: RHS repeat-associated core domain-containing protein [Thermoanaerobaculia bacterium]|jgi:RHS repeat-associated protein